MRTIADEVTLRELYLIEKLTDVQIAEQLGCSKNTICRTRKKYGIEALERWERHECKPTKRQMQIILGSLLGDASISNGKKGKYDCHSIFEVQHCGKQKDYLFWKYEELQDLCSSAPKETSDGKWRLRTFHHPFFSNLRRVWYPKGTKTVTRCWLNQIGLLGLAVWYMDDGSLSKQSNFIKLHTCSFTEQEHDIVSLWLKDTYGIQSHMKIYSGYRNLVIDLDSRKKFIKMVKRYMVQSMKYKSVFREYYTWVN
jgi:recombination protein RecA